MEAKAPVWLHGGVSDGVCVLRSDLLWSRAREEVEIENATNGVVFEVLTGCGSIIDLDVHSIGVEKKNAMRSVATSVVKVDRVVPVQIGSLSMLAQWEEVGSQSDAPEGIV